MSGRIIFTGGNVFDGSGAPPFRADLAIKADRIAAVGDAVGGAREGDEVVDLSDRTLLPGLIDCHSHMAYASVGRSMDEELELSATYVAYEALAPMQATLQSGVTTVRDAGGAAAGLRRAVEDGLVSGPRLLVSLMQLSPSAGPYDSRTGSGHSGWIDRPGIPTPVADGPEALRAKVREYVQAGADVVKIFATGHLAMERDGARRSLFTDAELAAIVDEAGRHGIRVMAHAHGSAGAQAAARAGVASIEHGFFLDDVALDAMAAAGTVFVPTLLASGGLLEEGDDEARAKNAATVEGHRAAVRKAKLRGIPIAMGTDCPVAPHGRNLEELEQLVAAGLTPIEALLAATGNAARLLGLEAEIGGLAAGLRADLVVVNGDPLDVSGLKSRITDVYQRGVRVGPSVGDPR